MTLTQNRLKELLDYDPETGVFRWKVNKRNVKIGDIAGYKWKSRNTFYIQIGIDGRLYYGHRLAWFYVYGELPEDIIDHDNGDGTFNAISNLIDTTYSLNSKNSRRSKANTSGFTGVVWDKERGLWIAQIMVSRRNKRIGRFHNISDAVTARQAANEKYGFHKNHGAPR